MEEASNTRRRDNCQQLDRVWQPACLRRIKFVIWRRESNSLLYYWVLSYLPLNIQGIKHRQHKGYLKWCLQCYLSIRCKKFSLKNYSMNFLQYRENTNFILSHSLILCCTCLYYSVYQNYFKRFIFCVINHAPCSLIFIDVHLKLHLQQAKSQS